MSSKNSYAWGLFLAMLAPVCACPTEEETQPRAHGAWWGGGSDRRRRTEPLPTPHHAATAAKRRLLLPSLPFDAPAVDL